MFRRFSILFAVVGLLFIGWGSTSHAAAENEVVVLTVDGVVSSGMLSYFERGIESAENSNAEAVVIQIDTPGGAVDTTLEIIQVIRGSDVPVIVYVGPVGAVAGSAGSIITMAGHASAMAPDSAIGAASPVGGQGEDLNETIYQKTTELLTAEIRSLTEQRGVDATELAESMITDATAVSAEEALAVGLIDTIGNDIDDVLLALDGTVVAVNGSDDVLETAGASTTAFELNVLERLQFALAQSILVSLLMTVAMWGIIIELRAPGGYVAGGVGVLCGALAIYGLGQLEANTFGFILLGVAFVMFFLETQTPTYGILSFVGTIALAGGLWVLFNTGTASGWGRISLLAIGGISAGTGLFFAMLALAVARAQRMPVLTGKKGMIGAKGVARKDFKPMGNYYTGTVLVKGELWKAESPEPISAEYPVIIESFEGLTAHVKPKQLA